MTIASDHVGIRAEPIKPFAASGPVRAWITHCFGATRAWLASAENAHVLRCTLESLPAETFRDTGIDPRDATGIASCQPDLPFFMQSGFGRR